MTQLVTSLESVAVNEDTDITKDEICWTQLLIISVVEGLLAAAFVYCLSLFLLETDVGGGPAPSIMFFR
jgi:hypothetical protein